MREKWSTEKFNKLIIGKLFWLSRHSFGVSKILLWLFLSYPIVLQLHWINFWSFQKKQWKLIRFPQFFFVFFLNYRSFFIISDAPLVKVRKCVLLFWASASRQRLEKSFFFVLNEWVLITGPFQMWFMKVMLLWSAPRKPWFGRENWVQLHF